MELKSFFAQDLQGNVIADPTVYIYTVGTTSVISGLEDENGDALTNPFTGSEFGQIVVAAPSGTYDMRVTGGGRDFTQRVQFIDLAEQIAEAEGLVTDATNQANAAAASAAAAAEIVNIADVVVFTNPLTAAVRVATTGVNGSSNGFKVLSNAQTVFGIDPFAIFVRGGRKDYVTTNHIAFNAYTNNSTLVPTVSFSLSGGNVTPTLTINSVSYTPSLTITEAEFEASADEWGFVVVPQSATTAGSVSFYRNGVPFGTAAALAAGAPYNFPGSDLAFNGHSTKREAADHYRTITFNRAPTAAEVLEMHRNGIPKGERGASNASLISNGDFETWLSATNPGSWTEGSAVSASVSQVTGADAYAGTYSLQFTGAGLPSNTVENTIHQSLLATADLGRRIRIKIAARRISGTGTLYVGQGDDQYSAISTGSGLDSTWKVFTIEKTLTSLSTSSQRRLQVSGGAGSVFQVDEYSVKFIGITGLWDSADAQSDTGQIFDSSGNKNHALLPSSVGACAVIPARRQGQVRGTNEWTASSSTQYVVGTNQNHIPAQAAWTTIDIIASGSVTVHIGDGSDVDRYGASIVLAAGKNRVTLITPFNDGTNLKLTLTPTSSFTGTLETTASFVVLED